MWRGLFDLYSALHDFKRYFSHVPPNTWDSAYLIRAFFGVKSASSLSSTPFLFLVPRAKPSIDHAQTCKIKLRRTTRVMGVKLFVDCAGVSQCGGFAVV